MSAAYLAKEEEVVEVGVGESNVEVGLTGVVEEEAEVDLTR